jgi:hypothetical protein
MVLAEVTYPIGMDFFVNFLSVLNWHISLERKVSGMLYLGSKEGRLKSIFCTGIENL